MTDITLPDHHPLVMYSRGQISRQVAIDRLKIRDYAELLVALGDFDLPMPMPPAEQIERDVETFRAMGDMTLYDDDFVAWTRQQADLLRQMPAHDGLDIEHLVDEIEGLGRSAIAELSTAIRQVLASLIRRSIDPASVSIEDIFSAQSDAVIRSDAGVWRHVDLDQAWRLAKRSADVDLPDECPLPIEQLLTEDFDAARVAASLKL